MKTEMYVIYDQKAKIYNKPFHQINESVAIRTVADLVNDANSDSSRHPEDYILFRVATYDDSNAEIQTFTPELICKFHEIKEVL